MLDWGLARFLTKLGGMVFDIEPLAFASRDVGGKFVRKIFFTGTLPKLKAGTPNNRWIVGGGLWLHTEEVAEKFPMGLDSEKSFAKMDEDRNVAD
jgi:hypothetical protein